MAELLLPPVRLALLAIITMYCDFRVRMEQPPSAHILLFLTLITVVMAVDIMIFPVFDVYHSPAGSGLKMRRAGVAVRPQRRSLPPTGFENLFIQVIEDSKTVKSPREQIRKTGRTERHQGAINEAKGKVCRELSDVAGIPPKCFVLF